LTGTVRGLQVGDNLFELFTSKTATQPMAKLVVVRAYGVPDASAACAALTAATGLPVPNTVITSATLVAATANTPEHCNVVGTINGGRVGYASSPTAPTSAYTYAIKWQARLPTAWNGRFYVPGGGGTDGSIPGTTSRLIQGYAEAANDSGHDNNVNTDPLAAGAGSFGTDYQARVDFAYNAIDVTTQTGKALSAILYSKSPVYSYFEGCSMGGREAMMVTQRLPDAFNGVVAGDPGFRFASMLTHAVYNSQVFGQLAASMGIFSRTGLPLVNNTYTNQDLQLISKAVLDACDALDGLVDGMVNTPLQCTTAVVRPKLDALQCNGAKTPTCLTAGQIDTMVKVYEGPVTPSGQHPYFGWMWDAGIAGCTSAVDCNTPTATNIATNWRGWKLGNFVADPGTAENTASDFTSTRGGAAATTIVPTPPVLPAPVANEGTTALLMGYDLDQFIASTHGTSPAFPVSGFDLLETSASTLAPFASHGGKLVIYQPQSGGPFSPLAMVDWYKSLNANNGGSETNYSPTQQYARLYMIPGMQHCGSGPATSTIDPFTSVVQWVESGTPPDRIIGTAPSATPWPGRTRPLCPFPAYAQYTGSGSIENEANFVCTQP
ncbi:MAG: tannase/feruloyl esterase family alpha/beta hydrolase, partial [Rhizobacter sp.]